MNLLPYKVTKMWSVVGLKLRNVLCLSGLLTVFFAPVSWAGDVPVSVEGWHAEIVPYFWMPAADCRAKVGGITESFNLDVSDNIDSFPVWSVSGRVEIWRGRFGLFLDGTQTDLAETFDKTDGDIRLDAEQFMLDVGAAYRVYTRKVGTTDVSCNLLGGGRYTDLRMDMSPSAFANRVTNRDWVEPFLGISFKTALGERTEIELRGDAGGFRIGSAADITWNIVTSLEYSMVDNVALMVGYRVFEMDYDQGHGERAFEIDTRMHGPTLGLALRFGRPRNR